MEESLRLRKLAFSIAIGLIFLVLFLIFENYSFSLLKYKSEHFEWSVIFLLGLVVLPKVNLKHHYAMLFVVPLFMISTYDLVISSFLLLSYVIFDQHAQHKIEKYMIQFTVVSLLVLNKFILKDGFLLLGVHYLLVFYVMWDLLITNYHKNNRVKHISYFLMTLILTSCLVKKIEYEEVFYINCFLFILFLFGLCRAVKNKCELIPIVFILSILALVYNNYLNLFNALLLLPCYVVVLLEDFHDAAFTINEKFRIYKRPLKNMIYLVGCLICVKSLSLPLFETLLFVLSSLLFLFLFQYFNKESSKLTYVELYSFSLFLVGLGGTVWN